MAIRYRPRTAKAAKRDTTQMADMRVALYCRVSKDEQGLEKSVDDQEAEGRRWCEKAGATVAEIYRDTDRSASRYATKEREGFARLLADIQDGSLDAVWFWELSRSQRRLDVFAKLRDTSRDLGVLWVVRERVYDPSNYADMMTLGLLSVIGEGESEITAERVRRGLESNATAGKPHAWAAYGYRRVYDPHTRRLVRQEPDVLNEKKGRATGEDPEYIEDSPAYVVREIFARLAGGQSVNSIVRYLNERGVPSPKGTRWRHASVLYIAKSHTYLGQRVHQGEVLDGVAAQWPALVDAETFWAVQRVLNDKARDNKRPGRTRHLLSYLALCAVCDGPLQHLQGRQVAPNYSCKGKYCVRVRSHELDEYVGKVIVRWLSDPEVFSALTSTADSAVAAQARADIEQLRAELDEWQRLAEDREVTPAMYARVEQDRMRRIAEAEELARDASTPPVLIGNVGPQAAETWAGLSVEVRREIIRSVAEIRLRPAPRGPGSRKNPAPISTRVEWRWLIGGGDARSFAEKRNEPTLTCDATD